jgi:hypothetical protein
LPASESKSDTRRGGTHRHAMTCPIHPLRGWMGHAALGGHLDMIGPCIGTLGVDVHAVDRSGRTGLMRATPTECETLGFGVGETLTGIGSRRCFHTGIGAFPHQ